MDILELIDKVSQASKIKPVRLKDIKSSARQFSRLLGYTDPQMCPEAKYLMAEWERKELIERGLPEASAIKIRNLKNNLAFLFRHAEELNLVRIQQVRKLTRRRIPVGVKLPVSYPDYRSNKVEPYLLHRDNWPASLRREYKEWHKWASADFVPGRSAKRKLRPASIIMRRTDFERFFGYLMKIRRIEQIRLCMFMDVGLITDFAQWHVNQCHGRVTRCIKMFLQTACSTAAYYFGDEDAAKQLKHLNAELGTPPITFDKASRMVSVADLISVGISDFPRKNQYYQNVRARPRKIRFGSTLARYSGRAVAILLLATRPLRQKNYREARIGKHLYKDSRSQWVLEFRGDDGPASLKKKQCNGLPNVYRTTVPDFVVPYLEEYLDFWRPLLTTDPTNGYLFLNGKGEPYDCIAFTQWIQRGTCQWLGKRVNPHLFRDIVATEIINETGDYVAAATLLNDDPTTVFKHYWHLSQQKAAQTVDDWLAKKMSAPFPRALPSSGAEHGRGLEPVAA